MNQATFIIVMALVWGLVGCSTFHLPDADLMKASAYKDVKEKHVSPAEAIFNATNKLKKAEHNKLDFYSPLHIKKARYRLSKANALQRLRSTKRSRTAAAISAIMASKIIEAAEKNKIVVLEKLKTVFEQKAILEEIKTKDVLPEEYAEAVEKMGRLIRYVEKRDFDRVGSYEIKVLDSLNRLEGQTLKITLLEKTRSMLLKAASIQADKFAQDTFNKAQARLQDAERYIEINYKNRAQVIAFSNEAFLFASQAFFIALEVQKIAYADPLAVEKYILDIQALLEKMNKHLKIQDLYSYSFKDQVKLMEKSILKWSEVVEDKVNNTSIDKSNDPVNLDKEEYRKKRSLDEISINNNDKNIKKDSSNIPANMDATKDEVVKELKVIKKVID